MRKALIISVVGSLIAGFVGYSLGKDSGRGEADLEAAWCAGLQWSALEQGKLTKKDQPVWFVNCLRDLREAPTEFGK